MQMIEKILSLLLAITAISNVSATPLKDDDPFVINEMQQELEFFMGNNKMPHARLKVKLEVQCLSSLEQQYGNSIFVDDYSFLEKLYYKNGKKNKKMKIVLSDYEIDGIFHSDAKVCYFDYAFIEKDQVEVIHYEKVFTDLKFLNKMFFGESYKVLKSNITITVPEWMDTGVFKWHFDQTDITSNTFKKDGSKVFSYQQTEVEPMILYRNEPSASKTRPHLIVLPKAFTHKGKEIRLMKETSDLYAWYRSLVLELEDKPSYLETLVTTLTKDAANDKEKIKNIFYWVQDNIKYIAFEDGIMGFKPETCQDVYNNKYSDCKGMANLTKNMLQLAGYDARLTWLGTNDIPYTYSMPSLLVDNHMICTVILDGKKIFLDATEKYSDLENYAQRIEGKEVMIENGDEYLLETIPVGSFIDNKETYNYDLLIDGQVINGKGEMKASGTRKTWLYNFINSYKSSKRNEVLQSYIDNGDKNIVIDLGDAQTTLPRDASFSKTYDIKVKNKITTLADELYINLELDNNYKSFEIPKDRSRPIELSGKYFTETLTTLTIPEGYSASYLPEALDIVNDICAFQLSYTQEGNTIKYNKSIKIKSTIIPVEQFDEWTTNIKSLNKFYSDQIILTK